MQPSLKTHRLIIQTTEKFMKKLITLLFLTPLILSAVSNDKVVTLKKIDSPIKIDGIIDGEWNSVTEIADFFQLLPYYAKEPSRKTYAKVLTTEYALYCLIVCYDSLDNIQQHTGKLDDFGGGCRLNYARYFR